MKKIKAFFNRLANLSGRHSAPSQAGTTSYLVERIVFDLDWEREVLVLHTRDTGRSVILSLELNEGQDQDLQQKQSAAHIIQPLLQSLDIQLLSVRLFRQPDSIPAAQCLFRIGRRKKSLVLDIHQALSMALHSQLGIEIAPELLIMQKQNLYTPEGIEPAVIQAAYPGNVISYSENEVIM